MILTENDVDLSAMQNSQVYSIEKITLEMFGNVQILSSDFLYSLDNSEDFVYVEFVGGGYAIYLKSTMELMEYSAHGSSVFKNVCSKKYYGGPGVYLTKSETNFIDATSGAVLEISDSLAKEYSRDIRDAVMKVENDIEVEFDFSTVRESENSQVKEEQSQNISVRSIPSIDDWPLITYLPISGGNSYVDTYLYVLDTTDVTKCSYNNSGGGNSQASLTMNLVGGKTYFVVVSTYDITTTTGQFYLNIDRQ